jgi:hypothetical protein
MRAQVRTATTAVNKDGQDIQDAGCPRSCASCLSLSNAVRKFSMAAGEGRPATEKLHRDDLALPDLELDDPSGVGELGFALLGEQHRPGARGWKGAHVRPKGSPKELEARRFLALPLIPKGMTLTEIACLVGCHPSSVMRWRDLARRGGRSTRRPHDPAPDSGQRSPRCLLWSIPHGSSFTFTPHTPAPRRRAPPARSRPRQRRRDAPCRICDRSPAPAGSAWPR